MATSSQKSLSMKQRIKAMFTPCKSKAELKNWIKYHMGMDLPDTTVSRYADTNPLDSIWQIYDICVNNNNPELIDELLYVASRGSGKCAEKGTQVLTARGIKPIEDITTDDYVFTGWHYRKVKATFDEGMKKGVRIYTRSSSLETPFEYTGTPHHRLQAIKKDGSVDWVHMRDLSAGDWVYKSAEVPNVNTEAPEFEDGWLIGALCGDGNICVIENKTNRLTLCSEDFTLLRMYADLVYKKFGVCQKVKRNSKKSVNLTVNSVEFLRWFKEYVDGELCYDKKLKSINHSFDFLAGFIAGLMDTDGYRDGIDLANKELIHQIGQVLNIFGVSVGINDSRRKPRYSQIANRLVSYHSISFRTKLPECLMPQFSKYDDFADHRDKMNEQFRFPYEVAKPFIDLIQNKLKRNNGYVYLEDGTRQRIPLPYAKTWCDSYKSDFVSGRKLKGLRQFFYDLEMIEEFEQLNFILNGYFEQVDIFENGVYYFYDLEIDDPKHAYWSNGFISHNTLGVAIAELLVILHDRRDVVHVGAILSQAKRCYDYQKNFMLNDQFRDVLAYEGKDGLKFLDNMNMEKSAFNLIDKNKKRKKATLEVLPCTLKACLTEDSILYGDVKAGNVKKGDMLESPIGPVKVLENKILEKECLEIELDDGTIIRGTLNHKIMTNAGWIELQDLNEEHVVLKGTAKQCKQCGEHKEHSYFSPKNSSKDGLQGKCKPCRNTNNKKYREQGSQDRGTCALCGADQDLDSQRVHKEWCKTCYRKKQREATLKKTDRICVDCASNSSTKWYKGPKCRKCYRVSKYANMKENDRDKYKAKRLRNSLRSRLHKALKGQLKNGSAVRNLGCSIEELKAYLESKFLPGMTWENWSRNGWHIDHVKPLASFDLSRPEELKKACHYTNLQPLWAEDNLLKGGKYYAET